MDLPVFTLEGSTALVTGAARGLGAAISVALAAAGADVVLGLRSQGSGTAVIRDIEAHGRRALPYVMDVHDLEACRRAIDRAIADTGGIDILVNNAGGGVAEPAIDVAEEHFDLVVALNLKSAFFLSQHLARHMRERRRGGRIINISSQASIVALPGEAMYCMPR
jgi:NAD(P)-dependent dehydrogenase (short-subunit alcohol dehydrogenase family)